MKKHAWLTIAVLSLVVAVGIFAVLNSWPNATNERPRPKLGIGYLPIAAELPLFVAVEKGYFDKAGIQVELIRMASSNEMGNAATADRIDILAGAASNVVFDIGHISGKKHLVFAVNPYSNTKGHVTDHMIARKGSDITTLEDLKGKKVASFPGSVNRIFTYLILEKHGVPRDSYEYLELQPKDWQPSRRLCFAGRVVCTAESAWIQELREYAWKYFSLHAEQRLKAFHFFVILATVLVECYFHHREGTGKPRLRCTAGISSSNSSFCLLETRST